MDARTFKFPELIPPGVFVFVSVSVSNAAAVLFSRSVPGTHCLSTFVVVVMVVVVGVDAVAHSHPVVGGEDGGVRARGDASCGLSSSAALPAAREHSDG